MNLPIFPSDPTCCACPLGSLVGHAGHVGIPARALSVTACDPCDPTLPLVVCVGQNPGHNENIEGECFVGRSGSVLVSDYLEGSGIRDLARFFLTNAARCWSINKAHPSSSHLHACAPHLHNDFHTLHSCYPLARLRVVLALGAKALASIRIISDPPHTLAPREALPSLTDWGFSNQLLPISIRSTPWILCSTYHPAACLYDPNNALAVDDHLRLVRLLLTDAIPRPVPVVLIPPGPPPRKSP